MERHITLDTGLSRTEALRFLAELRARGIQLSAIHGRLYYRARKNTLTSMDIEQLAAFQTELCSVLEREKPDNTRRCGRLSPRAAGTVVPASFQQLAHWHAYRLGERRSLCQGLTLIRLRGELNRELFFDQAVHAVLRRHEALRSQLILSDGGLVQTIQESVPDNAKFLDLTPVPAESRTAELHSAIDALVLAGVDVARDPLVALRLIRLEADEHVLLLALEHAISDARSSALLTRELLCAYTQAVNGRAIELPEIPVQYADYAVWQRQACELRSDEQAFGRKRLAAHPRVRFPVDMQIPAQRGGGWGAVPFEIEPHVRHELLEGARRLGATLPLALFSAYAVAVLRWCHTAEAVLRYQSNGRTAPQIENTVGYFAAPLFLHTALGEEDRFIDVVRRVSAEWCQAYERAGAAYYEAQVPRPDFTRNAAFNWIPSDDAGYLGCAAGLSCTPIAHAHPMWRTYDVDTEPLLELGEEDGRIRGRLYFPKDKHASASLERFVALWLDLARTLCVRPNQRIRDHRGLAMQGRSGTQH